MSRVGARVAAPVRRRVFVARVRCVSLRRVPVVCPIACSAACLLRARLRVRLRAWPLPVACMSRVRLRARPRAGCAPGRCLLRARPCARPRAGCVPGMPGCVPAAARRCPLRACIPPYTGAVRRWAMPPPRRPRRVLRSPRDACPPFAPGPRAPRPPAIPVRPAPPAIPARPALSARRVRPAYPVRPVISDDRTPGERYSSKITGHRACRWMDRRGGYVVTRNVASDRPVASVIGSIRRM